MRLESPSSPPVLQSCLPSPIRDYVTGLPHHFLAPHHFQAPHQTKFTKQSINDSTLHPSPFVPILVDLRNCKMSSTAQPQSKEFKKAVEDSDKLRALPADHELLSVSYVRSASHVK